MNKLIQIFKALSDQNRFRIIKMLENRSMCVCEITEILQLANSTVSKHLSILKQAGLIISEKEGRWIHYKLNHSEDQYLTPLLNLIEDWANDSKVVADDKKQTTNVDRNQICSS